MIQIVKGSVNSIALTLTEKSTLTNPVYLFVFQSDETRDLYKCISTDTSSHTGRYNLFAIAETVDNPDALAGEITLPIVGFYKYTIYEQEDTENLDPSLSTGVVEIGKAQVITSSSTDSSVTNTNINYVYNE